MDTELYIRLLIKNDLINKRLLGGLNQIGLEADDFLLSLNDMVFELLKLEDTDPKKEEFYDLYDTLTSEILKYPPDKWQNSLDRLSKKIFKELLLLKNEKL